MRARRLVRWVRSVSAAIAWLATAAFVLGLIRISLADLSADGRLGDSTCGSLLDDEWRRHDYCRDQMVARLRLEVLFLAAALLAGAMWWVAWRRDDDIGFP